MRYRNERPQTWVRSLGLAGLFVMGIALPYTQAQERDPKGFHTSGYIQNAFGGECWYTQVYERTNPYFMPERLQHITPHDVRTIHFTDAECMADVIDGLAIAERLNKVTIAQQIARWFRGTYIAEEAQYDVKHFYPPGEIQSRGVCMIDPKFPLLSIAIDFISDGDSITDVIYAPSMGCGT